jgi:uncharacterized protein (TIGR03435 family)
MRLGFGMVGTKARSLICCGMFSPFVAGAMALTGFAFGQTGAPQPRLPVQSVVAQFQLPAFEVASVKQNKSASSSSRLAFTSDGVTIENVTLLHIIRAAYGMFNAVDDEFIGVPGWAKTENFDIEAKVDDADVEEFQKLNFDKRQLMVQALLTDRFKLRAHHETRELPVYELVVAKNGPMLQVSNPGPNDDPGGTIKMGHDRIAGQNVVVSQLVTALTHALGRKVVDKTTGQLPGKYDFTLNWTPDEAIAPLSQSSNRAAQGPDASGPSIFTAIQEQLGLKLVPAKGPVEVLVIDHVEYPSMN